MRDFLLSLLLMLIVGCIGLLMSRLVGNTVTMVIGLPFGFLIGYFGMALFTRLKWTSR